MEEQTELDKEESVLTNHLPEIAHNHESIELLASETGENDDTLASNPKCSRCNKVLTTSEVSISNTFCRKCCAAKDDLTTKELADESSQSIKDEPTDAKCQNCRRFCYTCTKPCAYYELDQDASCPRTCRHAFLCPPFGKVAKWYTRTAFVVCLWAALWSMLGESKL